MKIRRILSLAVLTLGAASILIQPTMAETAKVRTGKQRQTPGIQQRQGYGMQRHGQACAKMGKSLNLTDDQKARIKSIHETTQQQVQAVRQDKSLTDAQKQNKIKEIRLTTKEQIKAVLTPAQQQKLKETRTKMQERRGNRGDMAGLNLTDQQKAQIKSIREDARQQVQAIQNDSSLAKEQKMAKVKEIRKATIEQIKSILTPEQREKIGNAKGNSQGKAGQFRNGAGLHKRAGGNL